MMNNLKRILQSQREELLALNTSELCTRPEESELQLDSKLAQVVIGVRRSGKSTLCQKVLIESGALFAYVNFDDERLRTATPDDLDDILLMLYEIYGNFTHLFLDEVQNIADWALFVNRLLRQQIHLIITGSNANLLSGELSTHLTGRYHQIELFPFSFMEVCQVQGLDTSSSSVKASGLRLHALSQYMVEGGFPELLSLPETNRYDYLQSLLHAIIEKDICRRYRVRYKKTLSDLANKMLDWFCQEKSLQSITAELGIQSIHTTKNYLQYLQDAYLLYLLPKFSLKSSERTMARKAYSIDPAFISTHENALLTESYGLRLENVIALEIARRLHREYQQVYYLRKEHEYEVDFVVVERSRVKELIQVTYDFSKPSDKLYNREIDGLIKGSAYTHCDNLTLIMMYGENGIIQKDGKTIRKVTADEWLTRKELL